VRSRRLTATLVATAAVLSLAITASADTPLPHRPGISFTPAVPEDLRALASDTWQRFLDAFPARWGCLSDVTVTDTWGELGDRGAYDPEARLVTVRVPGTGPNLSATLVHEFAHHLEFTCPEQVQLRPRFLAAQGIPAGTPWRRGDTWADIPSEQFAQATIQVVLGPRPDSLVLLRPGAVAAIRDWGLGR